MAEAVVSFLVESIREELIDELNLFDRIIDEAEHLRAMLLQLRWFLKDADAIEGGEDEWLRDFVSKVRDIADEAKLVLGKHKVESQRKGGFKNVLNIISFDFVKQCKMRRKIQGLTYMITRLTEDLKNAGIIDMVQQAVSSRSIIKEERTYSHEDDLKDFVGLEKDVETLANHLMNEDDQGRSYRVVSISGIGGSGKTTLAIKVYNHPEVKRYFDGFAWVDASQRCQPEKVLQMILHQLMPEKTEEIEERETVSDLSRQLIQIQNARRCLVVLDGIWSTKTWISIEGAFPSGEICSKILLTTRNMEMASHIGPNGFHYQPRLLDENEGWELLKKKALRAGHYEDGEENGKIEELGRQMAKYCWGLPLAVVVLGGILAKKDPLTVWDSVYEDNGGEHQGELQKIFASTYSELPYQMKPCFLHLAQYPKDTYLDVLTLYQLWIAEGMILKLDRTVGESLMEMAERYLNTLVDMSMVQIHGDHFSVSRKFDSCCLHEMMRDFSLEEGRKEISVWVMDFRGSFDYPLSTQSAESRLVIYTNTGLDDIGSDTVAHVVDEKLRSLEFHNTSEAEQLPPRITLSLNLLKKLKYLTSLVFESYKFGDPNNLEEVFNRLVYLRFLSFKDCDLDKLPSSVCSLPYLRTLDLRVQWGYPFELPKDQWKTKRLRYIFFGGSSVEVVKGKLRLQGLSRLERIVNFQTDKMEVRDLFQLRKLRVFTAIVRDNNSLSLIVDRLKDVKMELRVRYCDFKNKSDLLRKVLECPKLFSLEILGPLGVELPMVGLVACLEELVLVHSEIQRDPMETLEMIPNLQRLVLGNKAYHGKEMHCSEDGFPNLKSLCLTELPNLEIWKVDDKAMPNLLRLVIKRCTKLKVPDGLSFITTLKQLNTWSMSTEFNDSVLKIKNEDLKECAFNFSEK